MRGSLYYTSTLSIEPVNSAIASNETVVGLVKSTFSINLEYGSALRVPVTSASIALRVASGAELMRVRLICILARAVRTSALVPESAGS